MADVPVTCVAVAVIFNYLIGMLGTAEARLGRLDIAADDAAAARASTVGVQAFVWLALAGILLGKFMTFLLPAAPSLLAVALVRAAFAAIVIFAAAGLAYVRGALNGAVAQ